MVNEAHVFLNGYVATDPTYWQNPEGRSKATLRLAYTPRHVNRDTGEWSDGPTSFVTVTCWRKLADNVAMCLHKGEPVLVRGRMQVRRYEGRDGRDRVDVEVDASAIGHDLNRGVSLFQRTRRGGRDTALPADVTGDGDVIGDVSGIGDASGIGGDDVPGGAGEMTQSAEAGRSGVSARAAGASLDGGTGPAGGSLGGGPAAGDEIGDVLDDRVIAALTGGGDGNLGDGPLGEEESAPV